eukprot:CAMPEP_0119338940 /NCGR_PEP_ID=MMETSP1333-20130426/97238_1 /TAXON_ID=418940 /ORGANISM="Scyphosphaera apsteinii, Strain RCC1455" /LENGTH=35 /DNA_ID= /DNA_START= /DNA_END= /DNA_ORIENTATION=
MEAAPAETAGGTAGAATGAEVTAGESTNLILSGWT